MTESTSHTQMSARQGGLESPARRPSQIAPEPGGIPNAKRLPSDRPRPAKQRAIVKAASAVFLAEGFERASLDQIAQRAGVSKQTIYSHFADKQDLFKAICTELTEKLTIPLSSAGQTGVSLEDLLTRLGEDVLAMMCEPASLELHRLLLNAVARFPELGETAYQAGANRMLDDLSQLLLQRSRVGEAGLAPLEPARARRLAEQFIGMIAGFHQRRALLGVTPMSEPERRLYSRECVELILRAA